MAKAHKARLAYRGGTRRGQVVAMVTLAILVLIGFCGLALDVGLTTLGCQHCQTIADAGALAGVQEWRDPQVAQAVAWYTAHANLPANDASDYSLSVDYYPQGETMPTGEPAPTGGALQVTASKWVEYEFLQVLGQQGVTVTRSATATRFLTGTCIAPIWIWYTTPVQFDPPQPVNLLMADAPHTGIPGSFGFLQPAGGVDFQDALRGTISLEEEELQRVEEGDIVWAYTGMAVDHWRGPLKNDWNSRLNRCTWSPWTHDTYTPGGFLSDNPRILIIPFVEYLDGTGAGARFRIHQFGAFWLQDVITNGDNRYIQGTFIEFMKPGGKVFGINPGRLAG